MKEKDYTLVGDLQRVRMIHGTFLDITPENNEHIPINEYHVVGKIINDWLFRMHKAIKIEE